MNAPQPLESDQHKPVPEGFRRVALRIDTQVCGELRPCGAVLDVPRGLAQRLVAEDKADAHPAAIAAAFANAVAEKAILEAQLEISRDPRAADTLRRQIADVGRRLRVWLVPARGPSDAVEAPEPSTPTVPAIDTREPFREAMATLDALEQDLEATQARFAAVARELAGAGGTAKSGVDLVKLALSGERAPVASIDVLRDEHSRLSEHREIVVRALGEQRRRVELVREQQAKIALAELAEEQLAVARDTLAAIEILRRADERERALERALRLAGYGAEAVPPIAILSRSPVNLGETLGRAEEDARRLIERAQKSDERRKR